MARTTKPEVSQLAEVIAGAMPRLPADDQHLALTLYRRLAEGEPVTPSALAAEVGRDAPEVEATVEDWPGVYRAGDRRIVAFGGLAIPKMPHRFRIGGRQLHTWCAWDALFIPELIGRTAEVESQSPVSGDPVWLTVAPDRVVHVEPRSTVVSMLAPTQSFDDGVVRSFCHFVHFFPSATDADPWLAEHERTFPLSVDEAFELGRMTNRLIYGDALGRRDGESRRPEARPRSGNPVRGGSRP
jgi:alkylmercury lyase